MIFPTNQLIVVGIGASAGGLESFKELLAELPAESGLTFILIQHLSPHYPSMMADLLTRSTSMPVKKIEDKMLVKANHVYMIPPNKFLKIKSRILRLESPDPTYGVRKTIDVFFRSLAEEREERAIGIVLSGAGDDGVEGSRVIKERDGLVIAQDPETAAFSSMPQNVILAGLADHVLPINKMPDILIQYTLHTEHSNLKIRKEIKKENVEINFILAEVKKKTKDDFSSYKKPPLLRRIHKGMERSKVKQLCEYGRLLEENPSEVEKLHKDFIIRTTSFFRNPEVFETLAQNLPPPTIGELPFRVWIPGCSTGEEAYSLAMLLLENSAYQGNNIQIFATDIDDEALKFARRGIYPKKIESQVSPERLKKFFDKADNNYRVKPALRETVLFARRNLVSNISFGQLDLISCRNVLFYIEQEKQNEIIKQFHFSLKEGGYLFLALSETIKKGGHLFEVVSKKSRLFKRI